MADTTSGASPLFGQWRTTKEGRELLQTFPWLWSMTDPEVTELFELYKRQIRGEMSATEFDRFKAILESVAVRLVTNSGVPGPSAGGHTLQ
ncbi:MAG: hypothetical protein IOC39_00875 [Burkholderia sp.]|nr:hypothetical protein [Burkholderia sp.]MCA3781402.1 hypothetical protein [Burkholderia sp.]MCA3790335.1 hypothetical protein [Burkholderia sp.]MCA3795494.1 hypothetical protein [Burkholderia sp.]MCA3802315.1 hypothetical protein [Burkholderia sp.]MCA3808418.1 hypothetical protein [Burkholderia sp.]